MMYIKSILPGLIFCVILFSCTQDRTVAQTEPVQEKDTSVTLTNSTTSTKVDDIVLYPCSDLWWNEVGPGMDTALQDYFDLIEKGYKTQNSIEVSDSLHFFLVHLDTLILNNPENKLPYYYLVLTEPMMDGAVSEFYADIYFDLFSPVGNYCDFYQLLLLRDRLMGNLAEDLSTPLSWIVDDMGYHDHKKPGYLDQQRQRQLDAFGSNKLIEQKVNLVFDYIEANYVLR